MRKKNQIVSNNSFTEFLLYTTPNGKVKVEIFLRNENIWLTQAKIAELFGVDRSVVTKHLQNIYNDGELNKKATSAKIAQVQNEGSRQVSREDVVVAKNYLNKKELEGLNNIVEQYLIFAESQAKRKQAMFMLDWDKKLGEFLKLNDRDILGDLGKVSHAVAEALALGEYDKFRVEQDKNYISDFDREVKKILETKNNPKPRSRKKVV